MTHEPDEQGFYNPFMLWTDLGMRAAEMTMASVQNLTEGADRLTRAGAAAEVDDAVEAEDTATAGDLSNAWATTGLEGVASMQRLMWDLTTQNWLRWTSAVGNLMSAGAGVGLARKVTGQRNPLEAARVNMEHALASAEPKPARRAAAKARRTRGSSHK